MNSNRFEFALERLGSGDWERFEKLASTFLATEFPDLRTMASPSGDGGRDAILFTPSDDTSVVLQYSVTDAWEAKISKTIKRILEQSDDVALLIYVTNQVIGAKADKLRRTLRQQHRISLDIRDRSWFIERLMSNPQTEVAAEKLASEVVDPYLTSKNVIARKAQALDHIESRAAFVFLGLQLEDDTREKGLTRLSFEALVRAALRDTNSENRLTRPEVHGRVQKMLPNHPSEAVVKYVDSALRQLTKKVLRHWQAQDEFCLSHEENERIRNRLVDIEQSDTKLVSEIRDVVQDCAPMNPPESIDTATSRVRRIVEAFLLSRGEVFVSTTQNGQYQVIGTDDLRDYIVRDITSNPMTKVERSFGTDLITKITASVLTNPGAELREHLRALADAYTLLAFLRETPDVQQAVSKMFSSGTIWLDTSVVLPLFAEELVPDTSKQFTTMIRASIEAGLDLYITPGVLEEVERHMNLSLTCSRNQWDVWQSHIPFLYSVFIQSGRSPQNFPRWLENFRGNVRPEDDVADYLCESFNIRVMSLEDETKAASGNLRHAVQELWQSAHDRRRQSITYSTDPMLTIRLANHDVENYLGVLHRRRNERESPLGYNSWWLTFDRTAFEIQRNLKRDHNIDIASPVMSPDFMMNYLALGPVRMRVSRQTEKILPVVLELRNMTETLSPEFIQIASNVREQYKDLPEHVIRRKVRDELDTAKTRLGKVASGGLQAIEEELIRASKI
jgi:hypothetical protein